MTFEQYVIHLQNEIPRIGSGRHVVEAEIGTKWVRVRKRGKNAKRVLRSVWDDILEGSEKRSQNDTV